MIHQLVLVPLSHFLDDAPAEPGKLGAGLFPNRPKPLLAFIRNRLIERGVASGASRADAERAVDMLDSERPIIDWFFSEGGWQMILEAFLKILSLLSDKSS